MRFFLAIKPALAFNPHMQNETTQTGIEKAIQKRIADILQLIKAGWSKQAAIESVLESSTLGPKSWAVILASV